MSDDFTPLRVVVLTSHAAPGLELAIASPSRGAIFDIVSVVSSETSFSGMREAEEAGIPVLLRPIRRFHADHGLSLRNLRARAEYDEALVGIASQLHADYIALLGYNFIVSDALLEAFPVRIFTLYDGDLTVRDEEGRRRYSALHAVREAVFSGETETRSSAYFITREVGQGPLFLLSEGFPVSPMAADARERGDAGLLSAYASVHQRWMVQQTWGRMLTRGLEFLAAGTVQIVHDMVWIDGVPGPCRMGEAPSICRKVEPLIERRIPGSCPLIRE